MMSISRKHIDIGTDGKYILAGRLNDSITVWVTVRLRMSYVYTWAE